MAMVLVGLGFHVVHSYRLTQTAMTHQVRLKELVGSILHLDEVLTMSARMAAATGDSAWEERYRYFEPLLDADIKQARSIAGAVYSEQDAAQTDAANSRLVAMEQQALSMVRQQRLEDAKAILFGSDYKQQKEIYAQGMRQLADVLQQQAGITLASERRRTIWVMAAVGVAFALLLGVWLLVFRIVRHWQMQLLSINDSLSARSRELAALNATLDVKVTERTGELSRTNQTLKQQVESRKQAEETLAQKVAELQTLNNVMLGREERVLELKQEVNELSRELNREQKYLI